VHGLAAQRSKSMGAAAACRVGGTAPKSARAGAGGHGVGERPRKGRRRRAGPATAGTAGATSAGRGLVALMEERRGGGG